MPKQTSNKVYKELKGKTILVPASHFRVDVPGFYYKGKTSAAPAA